MEIVGDAVRDDGVTGVVTSLCAAAELRFVGKDVGELQMSCQLRELE